MEISVFDKEFCERVKSSIPQGEYVYAPQYFNRGGKDTSIIGRYIEGTLGISENNIAGPDFGSIEIKTEDDGANTPLTLFSKAPSLNYLPLIGRTTAANSTLVQTVGFPTDKNPDRKNFYVTMRANRPTIAGGRSFQISPSAEKLDLLMDGAPIIAWERQQVEEAARLKLGGTVAVVAANVKKATKEIRVNGLMLFWGFCMDQFNSCLNEGSLIIDKRLHYKRKARDHGSAFRTHRKNMYNMFEHHREIYWNQ